MATSPMTKDEFGELVFKAMEKEVYENFHFTFPIGFCDLKATLEEVDTMIRDDWLMHPERKVAFYATKKGEL